MTALNMKHFDVLNYVEKAKHLGVSEDLAKLQAREFEAIHEASRKSVTQNYLEKELNNVATKADIKDLKTEMKDLELRMQLNLQNTINSSTNKIIVVITFVIAIATFLVKFH